jgi:copper chaperone
MITSKTGAGRLLFRPRWTGVGRDGGADMAETLQIRVTGMTCGGCENAIRRTLAKIAGVESAEASRLQESVRVVYDPAKVNPDALRNAIDALGYKAHP